VSKALPDITTAEATVDRRIAAAMTLKPGEYLFPVIASNAAIAVGDRLTVHSTGKGVHYSAGGTYYATSLEIVAQNASGYVRCLVTGPMSVE
jgi:hypothetical protein